MATEGPDIARAIVDGALEILGRLNHAVENMDVLRRAEVDARMAAKTAERALADARTSAVIEIGAMLGPLHDPTTGRSNEAYTKLQTEHKLLSHGQFQAAVKVFHAAEFAWVKAQMDLDQAIDSLAAIRSASRVMAGIMLFIADDQPRAGASGKAKAEEEKHD